MSEKEKPFTVSDRRHFSSDGQAREQDAPPSVGDTPPVEGRPAPVPPAAGAPVSFADFVLSLGAQAGLMLAGQEGEKDAAGSLEAARHIISILEMLEEKTRAGRTPEEGRILDEMLFQLRMGYVQRAGRR